MRLILLLGLLSLGANAFDVLLTEENPLIEVEKLVEAGASTVRCEKILSTTFPRCILKMDKNQLGVQYEGLGINEVEYSTYGSKRSVILALESLKENKVCN